MSNTSTAEQKAFMQFMNLHDVFMNASLCHSRMDREPIEKGAEEFMASNRGRFERMWVTFLYVLVEAWGSEAMESAKPFLVLFQRSRLVFSIFLSFL